MKLRQATEEYINDPEVELAPRTAESYLHHCNRWERLTDDPSLDDINKAAILEFYQGCKSSGLAATTFQSSWRNIRAILRHAKQKGWISEVPVIRTGKVRKRRPVVPPWNVLDTMYTNVSRTIWPVLDYCSTEAFWQSWLAVSYWTGLRLGDMKELRSSDFNAAEGTLIAMANKTSKEHIYPVPEWLGRHIDAVSGSGDDRLFSVPRWSDNRIRRELARMCSGVDLRRPVSPQQIRRLSINTWTSVNPDAGKMIHGTGLGVLDFYLDPLMLLESCVPKMPVPEQMKTEATFVAG
ncbi:Phage integrase family protein [Gimesia alba]|uniref:Phage integrase family protein n=1 Tax=Gimesia alba TaxID=2527973 RepID=A0A517RB97_9PLAN|nr:phage integrase SAM-like domain-containing protein [Gimesia alba]QDT41114.1 Phage integrase family protein [Gimesia alba]